MTDIEQARDIVKQHYPEMRPSYKGRRIQIALAAIQSERERAEVLFDALQYMAETSDDIHDARKATIALASWEAGNG